MSSFFFPPMHGVLEPVFGVAKPAEADGVELVTGSRVDHADCS